MESFAKPLPVLAKALLNPKFLMQGVFQFSVDWFYTRRWQVVLVCLPVLGLLALAMGLTSWGNMATQNSLVSHYLDLVSEEVQDFDGELVLLEEGAHSNNAATLDSKSPELPTTNRLAADSEQSLSEQQDTSAQEDQNEAPEIGLMAEQEVSDYADLLLRRILQLQDSNRRAKYLVAAKIAEGGRLGQARSMMRSLAPAKQEGFAPAHAWLSVDRLKTGPNEFQLQELDILKNDLSVACKWARTNPALIGIYASVLEKSGEVSQALTVLSEAAASSDQLKLLLADMAKRHGREKTFSEIAESSKNKLVNRIQRGDASVGDYSSLAKFLLLEGEAEEAHQALDYAFKLDPENGSLKRLRSEAYRLQYRKSRRVEDGKLQFQLGLLDAALRSDPSNPQVGEEIAELLAMGQTASQDLEQALQRQLGNGKATALTHIMLAESKIRAGEIANAIPHLELALRQAPGNPTALNNLGLALAMTDSSSLDRALGLVHSAVAIAPTKAEYIDSLGEVRALGGDLTGAIECYEQAINMDASRVQTRQKLASAYREIGLEDLAKVQEEMASKIAQEPEN